MNKKLFVLVFVSLFCFSLTSAAIKDFNVESSGSSRLFVNGTTGLVGIGMLPTEELNVQEGYTFRLKWKRL